MSLHNKPEFNTPKIIAALKAAGLPTDTPSQNADSFRLGFISAQPGWRPARCEGCDCEFGGADCRDNPKRSLEEIKAARQRRRDAGTK